MSELTRLPIWQRLYLHYQQVKQQTLNALFAEAPQRFHRFSIEACGLLLDYSKNHVTDETLALFEALANARNVTQALYNLNAGAIVNHSEKRPALHGKLRCPDHDHAIQATLQHLENCVRDIHASPVTDIIHIGIGGSDLGPAMVCSALAPYAITSQRLHFISTLDASEITRVLKTLNAKTSVVIISSKSFTTQETLVNATVVKQWFESHGEMFASKSFAVTANAKAAEQFGIAGDNIFPLWEWVGGRYSIWSAIGLPVAIQIGMTNFREFLAGGHAMDAHVLSSPLLKNMPMILAFLNIWYTNFFGAETRAILPYDYRLARFPAYLQQLEMESNGKRVTQQGQGVDYQTGPIIWGEPGTNGQHAFHQLLHQGTQCVPVDFIIAKRAHHTYADQHALLFAHCAGQARALMTGHSHPDPARALPGNRPSNMLMLSSLSPLTLGALIALYEYKVFISAVIWDINPFDQWGVELGKSLANQLYLSLKESRVDLTMDNSTQGLMQYFLSTTRI